MHSGIVNKTRYDDPGKPMKQASLTVKNLGENLPEKQFIIVKRSFRSTAHLLRMPSWVDLLSTRGRP